MQRVSQRDWNECIVVWSVSAAVLLVALVIANIIIRTQEKLPPGTGLIEHIIRYVLRTSSSHAGASHGEVQETDALTPAYKETDSKPHVNFAPARPIRRTDEKGRPNYVRGQIVVQFRKDVPPSKRDRTIASMGARIIEVINAERGEYLIGLPKGADEVEFVNRFAERRDVTSAEPDYLYYTNTSPDDPLYAFVQGSPDALQHWYFAGLEGDACLNGEAAWALTTGRSDVVVAVIDTGISLNHPDLIDNLWINPLETPGNGIDDDGNGFVDDISGWDFYRNDADPNPDLGDGINGDHNVFHGTFVAGAIAAASNNGQGVAGVSWHSRLMPLKVFTDDGGAPSSAIAKALQYAANNGANIINMSLGSSAASSTISGAVAYAWSKGLILVAAAGNDNSSTRQYPARFPHVISVGGSGGNGYFTGPAAAIRNRASFSQYGPAAVDVVAPAVDVVAPAVYSTADQLAGYGIAGTPTYFYGNGTSFASALVAGEAALLVSRARDLGLDGQLVNEDYRQILLTSVVDLPDDSSDSPDGGPNWDGHGRVDFLLALQNVTAARVRTPSSPRCIAAKARSGSLELSWRDCSDNEQGFRIERARRVNYGYEPYETLAEVGPNVKTFKDLTAQPGQVYLYRVSSYNTAGTCVYPLRRTVTAR